MLWAGACLSNMTCEFLAISSGLMTSRYKDNPLAEASDFVADGPALHFCRASPQVVGFDLRNEIRPSGMVLERGGGWRRFRSTPEDRPQS